MIISDRKTGAINPIGIFEDMLLLDKDVIKAQIQAELRNLAEYRMQKIKIYDTWSKDPEKAKEILDEKRQEVGDAIVKSLKVEEQLFPAYDFKKFNEKVLVKAYLKALEPKLKWYQRLWKFCRSIVG